MTLQRTKSIQFLNAICANVSHLVVDVIRAQPPNDHANEGGTDGHSLEVALRVVGWPFGSRLAGVTGAAQELADVVEVGVGRRAGGAEEKAEQHNKVRSVFLGAVSKLMGSQVN